VAGFEWQTTALFCGGIVLAATAMSACLIAMLLPVLRRYTLAKPNERSSHLHPTPQGGGVAVVAATVLAACVASAAFEPDLLRFELGGVLAVAVFIALVGMIDDIHAIPILPRLLLQAIAVALVIALLPSGLRVLPHLSWEIERALFFVGGVWFVNLVNFMDGIDWMTVAEIIPVSAGLVVLGFLGSLPSEAMMVALALLGAVLGFAPFNRPVARIFLGDVGSLPIGLLMGWLLVLLAGRGHLAAAILLPLYYLADATITFFRLVVKRVPVWRAHRQHFYQRAFDQGGRVQEIVGRVFLVNILLAALALVTVIQGSLTVNLIALAVGGTTVGWLLVKFSKGR
jgi:UDP-N-acetylmuramyl pentapeptide phosphotransferase/UDP-N-acetylglucosamine-1-phosphate transferase